jgi:hypothetical protein
MNSDIIPHSTEERTHPEVIEPEIVGLEPPRPGRWRRRLRTVLMAGGLALAGSGFFAVGAVLTVTIIGAPIGVPLMLFGVLLWFAFFLVAGGNPIRLLSFHLPKRPL